VLNLDPAKLLVILVVALVILGPERLPQVARQLGGAWRTLTHLREQVSDEVRKVIPEMDLPNLPRAGAVTSFLTDLTRPPTPTARTSGSDEDVDPSPGAAATGGADPTASATDASASAGIARAAREPAFDATAVGAALLRIDDPSLN
jgi:sec-independent protein translocase protein TatB